MELYWVYLFKGVSERPAESSGVVIQIGGTYCLGCSHTRATSPGTLPNEYVRLERIVGEITRIIMPFTVVKS